MDRNGVAFDGLRINTLLEELIPEPKIPFLLIDPDLTVAELQALCENLWGIAVDAFRRNGYTWSDTPIVPDTRRFRNRTEKEKNCWQNISGEENTRSNIANNQQVS